MKNSIYPAPRYAPCASDLDLHCLPRSLFGTLGIGRLKQSYDTILYEGRPNPDSASTSDFEHRYSHVGTRDKYVVSAGETRVPCFVCVGVQPNLILRSQKLQIRGV